MKKLIFLSMALVMMLALAAPGATTVAQEKTKIDVWIAFQDYRWDWTKNVGRPLQRDVPAV